MPKRNSHNHILVIRLSAMGDVAMTVPVLIALRRQHPAVKITVITKPFFVPILSEIEGILVFGVDTKKEFKGLWGLIKLFRVLSKNQFTHIADLHEVLRSRVLSFLFRLKGKKIARIDKGRKEKNRLVRFKNKLFIPLKSTHLRYAEVFEKLGFPVEFTAQNFLPKNSLETFLKMLLKPNNMLVGIAPFAAHSAKAYSLEKMKKVVEELLKQGGLQIFLLGAGAVEQQVLEEWEKSHPESVVSMAGKFTLGQELQIISQLDIMISMDSGNAHLAANYGVPVVSIWGVTHPFAGFQPWQQPDENQLIPDRNRYPLIPTSIYGNKFPKDYARVIDTISERNIVNRVLQILN